MEKESHPLKGIDDYNFSLLNDLCELSEKMGQLASKINGRLGRVMCVALAKMGHNLGQEVALA